MTDVELTRALERGEIKDFHHASHLHVAWVYLTESSSVQQAARKMRNTLRRFAAAAGKPGKYHETITLFWVHLLSRAARVRPCGTPGRHRACKSAIAGKEFSTRLLFARAAFQLRSANFMGRARSEAAFNRCLCDLFIQFTARRTESVFILMTCASAD